MNGKRSWSNVIGTGIDPDPLKNKVTSVNGQTGDVVLNAEDVGALSQDDLHGGVALALQQAKDSGAFDGKDGKDGDDYILTEGDKQEIAEMIHVPESGGGSGEWKLIKSVTTEESVRTISLSDFEANEVFAIIKAGADTSVAGESANIQVTGICCEGTSQTSPITVPTVNLSKDTVTDVNNEIRFYSNGAFAMAWSNGGLNSGSKAYTQASKNTQLLNKITSFKMQFVMGTGRFVVGSSIELYGR